MRRIDKLGRIVIPFELRRRYGLTEGVKVEFLDAGEGITVRSSEPFCKVCRSRICDGATFPLCEACIAKAAKRYNERN
ncbi:MAG: AbrB/MazE/SpoVT family DNA-binding domain-containing protein [Clostridia bacterium]|nr:AbrB/MazE/SpoVT family DNA-binding domain-containing protein [Clostridia bacterium]